MNLFITVLIASFISPVGQSDVNHVQSFREQAEANRKFETHLRYLQTALNFVPFVAGVAAARGLEGHNNRVYAMVGSTLSALFSQHMIAQALNGPIMKGINQMSQWATSFVPGQEAGSAQADALDDVLTRIEAMNLEYEQVKDRLTKDTQVFFERLQQGIRTARLFAERMSGGLVGTDPNTNESLKKTLQQYTSLMRTVLNLPHEVKPLPPLNELKERLAPVLSRFDATMQHDIKMHTVSLVRSAKLGGASKSAIYLVGEPGTGKTTFVRMYAAALDAHLIEFRNLEQALKADGGPPFQYGDHISESFKLSGFTAKLTGSGTKYTVPKNAMLFLDEIDKFFQVKPNQATGPQSNYIEAFLLQLLDPNITTITLPDLGIEIDISGLIIVLAGNKRLPPALRNRMKEFFFPCIEKEKRPQIALDKYHELLSKRPDIESTEDDLAVIKQIGEYPGCGVRSLEFVVEDYLNHKDTIRADWNLNAPFDIADQYKKHPVDDAEPAPSAVGQELKVLNE